MTAEIEVELPDLYPKQEALLFHPARFVWVEGSTKSGKTAGCMTWQLAQAMDLPGIHWWVAPIYEQAKIAYKRVLKDFAPLIESSQTTPGMLITLVNGSEWMFKSADRPDGLYGEEVCSAVIDEASRTKETTWEAVRSTLTTTRGRARIIGNVRGRGNWHYRECRQAAQGGDAEHHYGKLVAMDAVRGGVLVRAELDQARRDLPDAVYKELYECVPSDHAYNPFGSENIAAAVVGMSSSRPVVWGLDIARQQDWTVLTGLDESGRVCAFGRWQGVDWPIIEERIIETMKAHGAERCIVLADATGIGDVIVSNLRGKGLKVEPYVFTSQSKQDLMQGLRLGLMDGKIGIPDNEIRAELDVFEYMSSNGRVRYSAPYGLHDDCVMSLALAWHAGTVLTSRVRMRTLRSAGPQQVLRPPKKVLSRASRFR